MVSSRIWCKSIQLNKRGGVFFHGSVQECIVINHNWQFKIIAQWIQIYFEVAIKFLDIFCTLRLRGMKNILKKNNSWNQWGRDVLMLKWLYICCRILLLKLRLYKCFDPIMQWSSMTIYKWYRRHIQKSFSIENS